LNDLRRGKFQCLVGVNLLREGLDLPEVSLVMILDADKEGFLRSETSLIQTIGRAARNLSGRVILFANEITGSIKKAIEETERRRERQTAYNQKYKIEPQTIKKRIRTIMKEEEEKQKKDLAEFEELIKLEDIEAYIQEKEKEMKQASDNLEFEVAATIRDEISKLKRYL
jgi:excinuclease ABC subunit B